MDTNINFKSDSNKPIYQFLKKKCKLKNSKNAPLILGSPIVIDNIKEEIVKGYLNNSLIGITDPTHYDIKQLSDLLGFPHEPQSLTFDFFGIKKESDGLRSIIFHKIPVMNSKYLELIHKNANGTTKVSNVDIGTSRMHDTDSLFRKRANKLKNMLKDINDKELLLDKKNKRLKDSNNLIDKAMAFKTQEVFPIALEDDEEKINYFQINSFGYSCSALSDGSNWFFVYQKGIFSASNLYVKDKKTQQGYYVTYYGMNAKPDISSVQLIETSPGTTVGEETVTSSVSYSISGEVGFEDNKGSGSVSAGMEIGYSTSVSIPDVSVGNKSGDELVNAKWGFTIPRVKTTSDSDCDNDLKKPVKIAYSTFEPTNQWLWRNPIASLDKNFNVDHEFEVHHCISSIGDCNIFGCNCDVNHKWIEYNVIGYRFSIPYPPNP